MHILLNCTKWRQGFINHYQILRLFNFLIWFPHRSVANLLRERMISFHLGNLAWHFVFSKTTWLRKWAKLHKCSTLRSTFFPIWAFEEEFIWKNHVRKKMNFGENFELKIYSLKMWFITIAPQALKFVQAVPCINWCRNEKENKK